MREALAERIHEIWIHWMKHLFTQGVFHPDGSFTIKASAVDRWLTQNASLYGELSEKEKDSDRRQADKILKVLGKHRE